MSSSGSGAEPEGTNAHPAAGELKGPIDDEPSIARELAERASTYWPHGPAGQVVVEHRRTDERPHSRLHWYAVRVDGIQRSVVVKVVTPPRFRSADRFTLATVPDAASDFRREYEALRLIDAHFRSLADERIANVPLLDRIESNGGFVHEVVAGTPMMDLLRRQHRFHGQQPAARVLVVSRNAGAWLREFHSVQVPRAVVDRPGREDFLAAIDRYASELGRTLGARGRFADIARVARAAAESAMPSELPLAAAHSDFVARNVLIQGQERVMVLDTLARRHAPVYEDLAAFMAGLRVSRRQLNTLGLAFGPTTLEAIERALLAGYFADEDPPLAAYRTYELLVLLDRLVGVQHWGRRGVLRRPAQLVARRLLDRAVDESVRRLV